jgi:sugar-specific transcriptional regulator TrmB
LAISEKARRALEELGLTSYEIRAYVALLDYGLMTAADISKQSGVPYSKIYDVLGSLEQKGWIEADHSRPSRFYPKSPATAIETMGMKLERERRENEEQVLNELAPMYERRGMKERPEIWIVRGEFNILSKVKETLQNCRRELMIALPGNLVAGVGELLAPVLMGLRERGVHTLIMTSESTPPKVLDEMARWADVRVREQMFGGGVISDAKEVVILLGEENEHGSHLAIWADHVGLTKFARVYFESLWNEAKTIVKA